jgi:hypothetical protein
MAFELIEVISLPEEDNSPAPDEVAALFFKGWALDVFYTDDGNLGITVCRREDFGTDNGPFKDIYINRDIHVTVV